MWNAGRNLGQGRPYPFIRVVIFDRLSLDAAIPAALVRGQPDIFNTNYAYIYPAVAPNARGDLGVSVTTSGNIRHPTITAMARPQGQTTWVEYDITEGHYTPSTNLWGDYTGIVAHEKYPNTWLGVGWVWEPDSAGFKPRAHNFWFYRSQDSLGLHGFNELKTYTSLDAPKAFAFGDFVGSVINVPDTFTVGWAEVNVDSVGHASPTDISMRISPPTHRVSNSSNPFSLPGLRPILDGCPMSTPVVDRHVRSRSNCRLPTSIALRMPSVVSMADPLTAPGCYPPGTPSTTG